MPVDHLLTVRIPAAAAAGAWLALVRTGRIRGRPGRHHQGRGLPADAGVAAVPVDASARMAGPGGHRWWSIGLALPAGATGHAGSHLAVAGAHAHQRGEQRPARARRLPRRDIAASDRGSLCLVLASRETLVLPGRGNDSAAVASLEPAAAVAGAAVPRRSSFA